MCVYVSACACVCMCVCPCLCVSVRVLVTEWLMLDFLSFHFTVSLKLLAITAGLPRVFVADPCSHTWIFKRTVLTGAQNTDNVCVPWWRKTHTLSHFPYIWWFDWSSGRSQTTSVLLFYCSTSVWWKGNCKHFDSTNKNTEPVLLFDADGISEGLLRCISAFSFSFVVLIHLHLHHPPVTSLVFSDPGPPSPQEHY